MHTTAYCEINDQPSHLKHDSQSVVYKFGDQRVAKLGSVEITFPVEDTHFAEIDAGLVDLDVPPLIGREVVMLFKKVLDIPGLMVVSIRESWEAPLVL